MQRYKVTGRLEVYGFAVHFDCIGTKDDSLHAGETLCVEGSDLWIECEGYPDRPFRGTVEEFKELFRSGFLEVE